MEKQVFIMIQRIQSLYLLITALLLVLLFFIPVFRIEVAAQEPETLKLMPFGVYGVMSQGSELLARTPYMGTLLVIALALTVVVLFLYRHRWAQIRLSLALIVLLAGLQAYFVYYLFKAHELVGGAGEIPLLPVRYTVADVIPVVGIILVYLAFRGIVKDETLIKSLDRIR